QPWQGCALPLSYIRVICLWYVLAFDGEDVAIIHICAGFASLFLRKIHVFSGEPMKEGGKMLKISKIIRGQ
ncbi:MAG: hypothetical protein IKT79_03085, partial [Akkermansia sp.]|nr:hypothetical protein [Akkermansia sp.]